MKFTWFTVAAGCALLACNQPAKKDKAGGSTASSRDADPLAANIDSLVKPGEDFFLYANGQWIKNNPIPESEASWGIGPLVQEDIYNRLRSINEKAVAEKAAEGTPDQKIGDFWYAAMDTAGIEKAGLAALQADFAQIDSISTVAGLLKTAGDLNVKGTGSLFGDYIGQDDMNSEKIVYMLAQGGIGMPNRDYYFESDAKTLAVRKAYQDYLAKTFKQLGLDDAAAAKATAEVYELEKRLAAASRKLNDLRDPYKNYNKMAVSKLQSLTPALPWQVWLSAVHIKNIDSVIVGQPEFYIALNKALTATPLAVWKNYLKFNHISDNAGYLNKETYMNKFVYTQSLTGASVPRDRWKRVLDAEEGAMGEALGQLFVKEYFNETAKKRYENMVEAVRDAFKERISKLTWMSDSTKQLAYDKLAKMKKKVGYPDKWKDFSALKIDRSSFAGNMLRANEWWHNYQVNKLGKPVDRDEWSMTPQTYNAYYNPSNNEIVLPAGIFAVPGKADAELDDALVYGYAAASTIGHEITHGFDDQGRQYDAQGNLRNWWTAKDAAEFQQRAAFIIKQFDTFMPVDSLHINGDATQGENIADLGGLLLGLDAFRKTEAFKKNETINGLNALQRYFLGYAYAWMYNTRKEQLANRVKTDVHSPAKERVNGPVVNIPEFYTAFGIKPGDKMYQPDSLRVNIW